jgi:hypothetical protein
MNYGNVSDTVVHLFEDLNDVAAFLARSIQ